MSEPVSACSKPGASPHRDVWPGRPWNVALSDSLPVIIPTRAQDILIEHVEKSKGSSERRDRKGVPRLMCQHGFKNLVRGASVGVVGIDKHEISHVKRPWARDQATR